MTTSSVLLLSVDEIFALKTPERKKDSGMKISEPVGA